MLLIAQAPRIGQLAMLTGRTDAASLSFSCGQLYLRLLYSCYLANASYCFRHTFASACDKLRAEDFSLKKILVLCDTLDNCDIKTSRSYSTKYVAGRGSYFGVSTNLIKSSQPCYLESDTKGSHLTDASSGSLVRSNVVA